MTAPSYVKFPAFKTIPAVGSMWDRKKDGATFEVVSGGRYQVSGWLTADGVRIWHTVMAENLRPNFTAR